MPFFQKILGTSRDYHKSAIKFSHVCMEHIRNSAQEVRIVLGWQTAWELRVPLAFLLYYQTLPHTTFTFFEDLLWQPSGNKEHPWFRQMAGVLHRAP